MPQLSDIVGRSLVADAAICGVTADSRKVAPGFLFAALPGSTADGRAFVSTAVARGAVAVLAPEGSDIVLPPGVALVTDRDPRRLFALAAAAFHGRQPETMAAVTGTNGKTSTAVFLRQVWSRLGHHAAALGTLGVLADGWDNAGSLTTPDPADLHATLAGLAGIGVTHACMEASSHGLDQRRLDGVRLKAAAFTNLTRDHLDYHGDMASYGAAKLRLFSTLLPADGVAVLNADDPFAAAIAAACRGRVLTYGRQGKDLTLEAVEPRSGELRFSVTILGQRFAARLPMAGLFQVDNALAALGLAIGLGAEAAAAVEALSTLDGVPGRMQKVAERANGAPVYVDYAHTPDALETVLDAVRPQVKGRLVVVFGCGGDRDPGKRPQMGAIADRLADIAVVTDDNPRREAPAAIRAAILAACPKGMEIADRRAAIARAVSMVVGGDVLVIAGKGHEKGQIVGTTVHPFDDAEEARRAVALADGGGR
ncbi:MAG: UDP-N-acetylmuramoyl-L-alanyl-D-glutamate--2,6-diaminopimelate ligase [Magnetospirillum sp.]|nr:UDP-N-acetylmuramoyl-L-alanyl-D-glutamate--2,6-diaminopimelate ligase [Magnetospirillum sp.]